MTLVDESVGSSRCPNCGATNPAQARFCSSCGAPLQEARSPREERKLVSVLFVDLVGFTARADRADPEDVREALQLYHAEAKRRIDQYGGVLEKFIGDAVMAVFGAPTAHGDDAERAVRAGMSVLDGISQLNREHALDLAARAAVNTGEAVVALDTTPADALATGDVVNTASRLQSAAPEGGLIVGAETYRATRHAILYKSIGPVEAKGKEEALRAWLAVEPLAGPAERPFSDTPLVGRSREVELMRSVWSRCLTELRPHLVTVLGPPGIGKSRLCREFAAQVSSDGGRILRGRCLPYEEQVGYQAFSRLVYAACGILESDAPAVAREKLKLAVERLMPRDESAESFSHLALLLGLAPDDEVPQMQLLFFAARRFMERSGLEQPTVFVFEDIHWAQASEIALLEYFGRHLRDSPVMIVAAARPELLDTHPTWGAGLAAQTTIPLDPLQADEAETLAAHVVQAMGEQRFDIGRVVDTAGGNPLFLEELAASLVELGASEDLPVTVREAIAARIDALPSDARTALLCAAVVGKTFWRGVVDAVGDIHEIDETLAVLEARDFIRRDPSSQLAGDTQFTFKHMLIREVAYSTVPRAMRRERHATVARYVEETLASAAETLPTILAHHWREAGEPARAIPYLLAAADTARRSWAQDAVIDLYSTAIELADNDELRRRLRLQRGIALVELADYPHAAEELSQIAQELEGQDKLDALLALHHAYIWTERDEEALATAKAASALADELGDETARPAALAAESQALAQRGAEGDHARALDLGDRALELWVRGTRPLDLAEHLHLQSDLTYWVGQYERSVELSRRTRALGSEEHRAESLLRGGGFEACALTELGRHEEAIAQIEEMLRIARELGQPMRVLLNYSTLACRELHDLDEARKRTEEVLELSAAMTFGMPKQFAGSDLIFTQLLAGDIGGAQAAWPDRWEDAEHATGWTRWLIVGRLAVARAEIALRAESPESAAEWAERALSITRRTLRRKYEARSLTLLGQALARLRRADEAVGALRSAVEIADDLVGPPGRWQARAAFGEVSYALGHDETAAVAYDEAAGLVEAFVATVAQERAASVLSSPTVAEILSLAGRSPVA
jgi:class 3 adenylate cyclase/tetratricopeptide (TPR) repeat protein